MDTTNISKDKFRFADEFDKTQNTSAMQSHTGYFHDAWQRFRKNKASIVASIIIIGIILFSLLTPLLVQKSNKYSMDSYYAKKGPYFSALSFLPMFDGGTQRGFNSRGIIHEYGITLGACDPYGDGNISLSEVNKEYTTVITPLSRVLDSAEGGRYTARIDTYAEVGFIYMQISRSEYDSILSWERENSIKVLYPLIEQNEYCPNPEDANYWYKVDTKNKNTPIDDDGRAIKLSEDMTLSDNYLRDENGQVVYATRMGGDDSLRVRVLYQSYYRYLNGESPSFILGTDAQGYDLSLRLSAGVRLSLFIATAVSAINFIIGAIYGAIEGYFGGAYDLILERISDILACVPFIVVATLFQLHLSDKVGKIASLLFAFVLTGWIPVASRVRTQFYRFKGQEYVMSARTLGASDRRIILKHIFPNALGTVVTSSVLIIPTVILNESMLSFLGIVNLGSSDTTSLGTLLSEASGIWTSHPHLMILPALFISLLMICFNLFGNGLRDALNPSLRGVEE